MNSVIIRAVALLVACFMLSACFSPMSEADADVAAGYDQHHLTINIISFNQVPFSRASGTQDITRLDIALFDASDNKVAKVNQYVTDNDFLHPAINVPKGELKLVIIAHSGNGVATITSPSKVTFPNNKVTDTFSFYTALDVTDDTPAAIDINLERTVAKVRLIMTDSEIPADLAQFQFYYTGGSSTFNPQTGYGSVNSRQTEIRTLAESAVGADGNRFFDIYTFPHIYEDELKLEITPMDSEGRTVGAKHILDGIPITPNYITECKGTVFTSTTFNIIINDEWDGTVNIEF